MPKTIIVVALLLAAGPSLAEGPAVPASFSEQEIRDGARAYEKTLSGSSGTTGKEAVKAAEFAGYVGGYLDAKTDGPHPESILVECLRTKRRSSILRRTAMLLSDPSNKPTGSVRFEVGFAAVMACKDDYWQTKTATVTDSQWVKFGENARLIAYFQRSSAAPSRFPTAWVLYDYKSEQHSERSGIRYRSEKEKVEVDCTQARSRTTFFTWHESNMGEGQVIYTGSSPLPWEPNDAPGSIAAALAAVICVNK